MEVAFIFVFFLFVCLRKQVDIYDESVLQMRGKLRVVFFRGFLGDF